IDESHHPISRAKHICEARAAGPEVADLAEATVAAEILGSTGTSVLCQNGLRPFEAAEAVASEYAAALERMAIKLGRKAPIAAKYSPLHSTDAAFRAFWKLREVIDKLEIPYD